MPPNFLRVSNENGQWQQLMQQWSDQCDSFSEALDDYAVTSLPAIRPLAESAQVSTAGVYSVLNEGKYLGICQLNVAYLPGYDGRVLRVRHIVHCPNFDFSDQATLEDYVQFLSSILIGVFDVSSSEMQAPYIKFHFKSPAERTFFDQLRTSISNLPLIDKVEMKGSWLYVKKKSAQQIAPN